ncbi:MAG: hypothetical protein QM727_05805 [Niabella sp.]
MLLNRENSLLKRLQQYCGNMAQLRRTVMTVMCIASFVVFYNDSHAQQKKQLATTILADSRMDTIYAWAKNLLKKGFDAGHGYPQVWIRDLNTFIETSAEVINKTVLKERLLTFYYLQQDNGEIVDNYTAKDHFPWVNVKKYISPLDTSFAGNKNTVETDQETSLIQAIAKYIRITGDHALLNEKVGSRTVYECMKHSVDFLLKHRYDNKYGLLTGATTQDWGDVQVEGGVNIDSLTHWAIDIYDNAMFVIALNDLYSFPLSKAERKKWLFLKKKFVKNIRKHLWDAKNQKFIPHIYLNGSPFPGDFDENKMHFHGGTAVAIEAGILSRNEIKRVNDQMVKNVTLAGAQSIGLTIYPPYPDGYCKNSISVKPYVYQNGGDWTWFGGRMIQQLISNSFVAEACAEVQPMLDRVMKNRNFYEWYRPDGTPQGSSDFRGEAGVLAKAIKMFRAWAQENK